MRQYSQSRYRQLRGGRRTHVFQNAGEREDKSGRLADERHRGQVERKGEAGAVENVVSTYLPRIGGPSP